MAKKTATGRTRKATATARKKTSGSSTRTAGAGRETTGTRHTSGKAGLRSFGKKMENSRHGFETPPAARRKAGAYGQEDGRKAKPRKAGTASRSEGKGGAIVKMKEKRTR